MRFPGDEPGQSASAVLGFRSENGLVNWMLVLAAAALLIFLVGTIIAIRRLAKVPTFDGTPSSWPEFKFRMRAFVALLDMEHMLAEAEQVVRGNIETAALVHGPAHRVALGTRMNLGILLGQLGKAQEGVDEGKRLSTAQLRTALLGTCSISLAGVFQLGGAQLLVDRSVASVLGHTRLVPDRRQRFWRATSLHHCASWRGASKDPVHSRPSPLDSS